MKKSRDTPAIFKIRHSLDESPGMHSNVRFNVTSCHSEILPHNRPKAVFIRSDQKAVSPDCGF